MRLELLNPHKELSTLLCMNQPNTEINVVFDLTLDTFQAKVLDNPTPILIDFWAPWCMPCRVMGPKFQQAAIALSGQVRAAKVNVDEQPRLAEAFGITGIPTLVLVADGRVVDAWSGVMSADSITRQVHSRLAK